MNSYLLAFDYIGVVLFAATGALSASRRELDILGFVFFAILTGIGGGTVREVVSRSWWKFEGGVISG
jgi:uncharacterized membrane protein YeiH